MTIYISLFLSILACLFLIGIVPLIWIEFVFVIIPAMGIMVRKLLEKQFSKYLVFDERTGIYALVPDTPRFFRLYSIVLNIFLGMLIGFALAYFFRGGWTK